MMQHEIETKTDRVSFLLHRMEPADKLKNPGTDLLELESLELFKFIKSLGRCNESLKPQVNKLTQFREALLKRVKQGYSIEIGGVAFEGLLHLDKIPPKIRPWTFCRQVTKGRPDKLLIMVKK